MSHWSEPRINTKNFILISPLTVADAYGFATKCRTKQETWNIRFYPYLYTSERHKKQSRAQNTGESSKSMCHTVALVWILLDAAFTPIYILVRDTKTLAPQKYEPKSMRHTVTYPRNCLWLPKCATIYQCEENKSCACKRLQDHK